MKNHVHLMTYVDRLAGGGFADATALLTGPLAGVFGGVHLLPFFLPFDGADAGFDPIDHTSVDARLGTWRDVRQLAEHLELMVDVIVNHASVHSPQFQDFSRKGDASDYAGLFLTFDRVFPDGATEATLLDIYRPRPGLPFTSTTMQNGEKRLLWTTFTPEQIDIDVTHPQGVAYLDAILQRLHEANVHAVRLDAAGYARKEPGTSCFMIPETYDFINEFTAKARGLSMEVLVEVHSYYAEQVEIARHVDWVYDFALPPLVLHALFAADAQPLVEWLRIRPTNAITVLDTHDGIGVIDVGAAGPDRPGLLSPDQINQLVETMHVRSNGESRLATGDAANNLDLYQVNCTYFDALGRRENEYLLARALQFFVPGIPQVYYVGLFGGTNDMALLETSHVGRDINRHHFSEDEVLVALKQPMVEQLLALIALRNTHPAFQGSFSLDSASPSDLVLTWRHETASAELVADLAARSARLTFLEADEAPVVITL